MHDCPPVAYTPEGGWTEMPPPVLPDCREPLAAGAPDLRGTWRAISVERDGKPLPDHVLATHIERVEQCGNRVVVTSTGIIHDMRADGTLENGVNDISGPPNWTPIHVAAVFNQNRLDLHPMGVHPDRPPMVTREIIDGLMIWNYGPFKVVLERIG
jgi:hypothetical protein